MDFIKKNWEKVLLGVVLVGLAVAVAFLPLKIAQEKDSLAAIRDTILHPPIKPLDSIDLAGPETLLKRSATPLVLDFSTGHRLFNPVLWQKTPDGGKLKVQSGKEIGPDALLIAKITPLFTIVTFDSVVTNETGARYAIGLVREAAEKPADRRKRQSYVSIGSKADAFTLISVKGPAENPTELTLELADSGEKVGVARTAPYKRVDGHLAELKYPPENRTWPPRRVGEKLTFAGGDYNIVAISETEVVVSAGSGKKTTVRSIGSNR